MGNSFHPLRDACRRAIYAAVAEARHDGLSVPASRAVVSVRFHVSLAAVAAVEREGLVAGWPAEGPTRPQDAA
jgi:hypothetical protein